MNSEVIAGQERTVKKITLKEAMGYLPTAQQKKFAAQTHTSWNNRAVAQYRDLPAGM